jgi:hypothetical protein
VIPTDSISVTNAATLSGVSTAAVTRWIVDGAKLRGGGRLKLRSIRLPGGFRTTEQWLNEFVAALTADRTNPMPATPAEEMGARRAGALLAASGW